MRQRCVPVEGDSQFQSFSYRPADPAWAPVDLVARCRKALKDYDSFLDLWWSPMRGFGGERVGRWRVVEWLKSRGNWDTAFYWEGADGSYREPSPQGILAEAQKCDMWARGNDLVNASRVIDDANARREQKIKSERMDRAWDGAIDKADIQTGKRFSVDLNPAAVAAAAKPKKLIYTEATG